MNFNGNKIRALLFAFAIGLAAVWIWKVVTFVPREVPVELPEATSESSVIEVAVPVKKKPIYFCEEFADLKERKSCEDKLVFGSKDMSLYSQGGNQGCGIEKQNASPQECRRSIDTARRFVWEHWTKRKRGYLSVTRVSTKNTEYTNHLFVEPKEDGSWRVDLKILPMLKNPDPYEPQLGELIQVEWKRADRHHAEHFDLLPNSKYLWLSCMTGDALIL